GRAHEGGGRRAGEAVERGGDVEEVHEPAAEEGAEEAEEEVAEEALLLGHEGRDEADAQAHADPDEGVHERGREKCEGRVKGEPATPPYRDRIPPLRSALGMGRTRSLGARRGVHEGAGAAGGAGRR